MYEIFQKLLDKRGLKAFDVSKATGISSSTLTDWKKGRSVPKQDKMQKIAEFLGVSLEYLMTGEDKSDLSDKKYYINEETAEMADKIFHSKELRLLFDAARDAQPEDLETVHHMLLALKRKERGDFD